MKILKKSYDLSNTQRKELAARYIAGETSTVLSKDYGITVSTVFRVLSKEGIQSRNRGPKIPSDTHRWCSGCESNKSLDSFPNNKHHVHGRGYICKQCRSLGHHSPFKLTIDDYNAMLRKQGGGCAICGAKTAGKQKEKLGRMEIDHCHKTGNIRGLLCVRCNLGIGQFNDDPALLRQAVDYLVEHSDTCMCIECLPTPRHSNA